MERNAAGTDPVRYPDLPVGIEPLERAATPDANHCSEARAWYFAAPRKSLISTRSLAKGRLQ